MARKVEVPAELARAVDVLLDNGISNNRAKDLFRYALVKRCIEREGNQAEAAKKLGMQRTQITGLVELLETRLS
jgi:transcriptional regulator with GAF, ATPase, and Fis domain